MSNSKSEKTIDIDLNPTFQEVKEFPKSKITERWEKIKATFEQTACNAGIAVSFVAAGGAPVLWYQSGYEGVGWHSIVSASIVIGSSLIAMKSLIKRKMINSSSKSNPYEYVKNYIKRQEEKDKQFDKISKMANHKLMPKFIGDAIKKLMPEDKGQDRKEEIKNLKLASEKAREVGKEKILARLLAIQEKSRANKLMKVSSYTDIGACMAGAIPALYGSFITVLGAATLNPKAFVGAAIVAPVCAAACLWEHKDRKLRKDKEKAQKAQKLLNDFTKTKRQGNPL